MTLENLRSEIQELTGQKKFPNPDFVSRVIYAVCSPSMNYLEDWFNTWFPIKDDDLRKFYPWITCLNNSSTKEDIHQIVNNIWYTTFDIGVQNALITKGYKVIDSADQIIFIGDLSDDNTLTNLKLLKSTVDEIRNQLTSKTTSIFVVGVFLIRNFKFEDGKRIIKFSNDVEKFLDFAKDNLDLLFLVDISNPRGSFVISESKDLHFLLGHLIYSLTIKPKEYAQISKINDYAEWIRRNAPKDDKVIGSSSISILLPIDQILETLLLKKSVEILKEAFWGSFPDEKINEYQTSLLNHQNLTSVEVFKQFTLNHPKYPTINPFGTDKKEDSIGYKEWNPNNFEPYIEYLDAFDASLASFAEENEKIFKSISKQLIEDFKHSLSTYINAIMLKEIGSFNIAKELLNKLKKHIEVFLPKEVKQPVYKDASGLIKNLREKAKIGPKKEAIIARTTVVAIIPLLSILFSISLSSSIFYLSAILLIIVIVSGTVYWFAWKNRIEKYIIEIWSLLREKWSKIMEYKTSMVIKEIVPKLISVVDEMISRTNSAESRMQNIIEYIDKKYKPDEPYKSAFWSYAIESRDEIERYANLINANYKDIAKEYILTDKPLELWNRLDSIDNEKLNEWEWEIVERAALKLIPFSNTAVELSIIQVLRDHPEKFRNIIELFLRSVEPFIILKEGEHLNDTIAYLEVPEISCDDIYEKFKNALQNNVQRFERKDSNSIYRISLISYCEGIDLKKLKILER